MKKSKSQKTKGEKPSAAAKEVADDLSGKPDVPEEFLIVGIGASAGGIQALKQFFEKVPADSGMAYVVILHLSPDHDSQLAEVLQTVAAIPVRQVTEKVRVQPNHVYVVPPNQHLEMFDGHIIVTPNISIEERRAPVDIFFRTLAESHHSRAVAVVLSGTGANGSMGIKRVKERGGAAFVQNPREAEFSEMPRNSIATDLIDRILNVADIPDRIIAYRNSIDAVEIPLEADARPEDQQQALREIFTQLRLRTGHDFSNYKRPTVLRRIERRINVFNLPDLTTYARLLRENADEANALLKDLLISVTNFFRDKDAFHQLESEILPKIFRGKRAEDQVRIWICGCATGEEAYSLAMLCSERTSGAIDAPNVQIFATDIDEQAIGAAREGYYTLNDAADVSPERLQRFFTKENDGFRVRRELREMILFANHNILKDPPFSKLDLTTCRNMLIYLNHTAQERVMETFHFALVLSGYLFLGNSESVDGAGDLFATVSKENRIYQSRPATERFSYPMPEASRGLINRNFTSGARGALLTTTNSPADADDGQGAPAPRISLGDLHQRLLEQYAPPSIVINEAYDIVHLSEHAGRFLQIAGGEPTKNLLKLIRPELRLELRTALYQVVQRQTNVEVRNLKIRLDEREETINFYARPVLHESDDLERGFVLVVFETAQTREVSGNGGGSGGGESGKTVYAPHEPITRQLEEELLRTKAQLRQTVEQFEVQAEELKASNEELQAINEELRSAAEELETSKEELQSVNEELITVNQELKVKIEEVSQTSNDFQNLINSTEIATIFLDRSFRVNTFTPAATRLFNLLPTDAGRPITDITNRLENARLPERAQTVLESLQAVEREISSTDGNIYLMRVLPYRTAEDRINGIVLTFFDITDRKQADNAKAFLAAIVESADDAMLTVDFEGIITSWNTAAQKLYGYSAHEAVGKPLTMLTLHEDLREVLANAERIKRGETIETYETVRVHHGGQHLELEIALSPVKNALGQIIGVSTIARDITERKRAAEALSESEERFRAMFEQANVGIVQVSTDGQLVMSNQGFCEIIGYTEAEVRCLHLRDITHPGDFEREMELNEKLLAGEIPGFSIEKRYIRKDGAVVWGQMTTTVVRHLTHDPLYTLAIVEDITEKKLGEETLRESEERLRLATEAAEMYSWELDLGNETYRFSENAARILGIDGEDLPATIDDAYRLVHPDDLEKMQAALRDARRTGEGFALEMRSKKKSGETVWLDVQTTIVKNAKGEPVRVIGITQDITTRKLGEETLRESEERLRLATEAAEMGTWEWNLLTDEILWNKRHFDLFGMKPRKNPLKSDAFFKHVHPDDRDRIGDLLKQAIADKSVFDTDFRAVLDGGGIRWMSGYGRVVEQSKDGEPTLMSGVMFDITERKESEQALRESEIRYRAIVGQATAGITELDLNGYHAFANPGYCETLGYTEAELLKMNLRDITHPDDYAPYLKFFKGTIKTGKSHVNERRVVRKNGEIVWITESLSRITDAHGKALRVATIAIDITNRRRAEEALAESETRLRLLIESASDYAIFTMTNDGLIDSWNAGAEKVFGWTEPEVLGVSGAIIFTPEDRKKGEDQKEMKTARRDGRAPNERFHLRKDGSHFYASGVMTVLKNHGDGAVQGFVKIARDMTEQIGAEKVLRDKELLQKLVGAQEDERKRIARDLHDELGQQLTVLRLKLDVARKMCEGDEICGKIDEIEQIARSIDHGVDFLAWELRPAALDHLGLVPALGNYVEQWSHHSGVTAELLASKLKRARFAPETETNLYRIVQEALNNTRKHARAKRVEVVLEKRDDLIILIIEDDGIGFNPEDKKKRRKGMGLVGMGERAQLIGGELEIESAPKAGTTIYVRVPDLPGKRRSSNDS